MIVARRLGGARCAVLGAVAIAAVTACGTSRGTSRKASSRSGFEHCDALMVDDIRAQRTVARVAVRDSSVVVTLRTPRRRGADAAFSGDSAAAWSREALLFVEDTLPVLDLDGVQIESRPLAGSGAVLVLTATRCYAPGPTPDTVWHAIALRRANGDTLIRGGISRERVREFVRALDSAATLAGRMAVRPR